MSRVLDKYYEKNPTKVVSDLMKMLPKFDRLDVEIQDLKENLDRAIEEKGPLSSKARKLRKELDRAEKERKALEEKKAALRKIPLKNTGPMPEDS
jgi:regulator of replication initiation timing